MSHLLKPGAMAFVCALSLAGAICSNAAPIAQLNPQPEPPSLDIEYLLTPDGADWFGTVFVDGEACGSMELLVTNSQQTGVVTHVGYALSITGDNPNFQLGAALDGVIVRHNVVLNGAVDSGYYSGQTIHPRGMIQTSGGSVDQLTSMEGELQLNPQPEPPSFAYPPSPCGQ